MTWRRATLGELEAENSGSIQTGPFGSQLHMSDYSTSGTPVVMPTNIRELRISEDGIARVSDDHVHRLSRHQLRAGDIVYSRRGDVEKCALITEREAGWLCGTGCLLVRVTGPTVDTRFLSYALSLPETRGWLSQRAVGATMPNLNTNILREVPVSLPPLPEQRAIAATLGALDDKMESNRRAHRLLWELMQAEWDSLTESSTPGAVGDVLGLSYGKALPAKERVAGTVPVYGSNGVTGAHNEALINGPAVIVGRKGSVGEVHWSHTEAFPIDTTFFADPIDGWPLLACFFVLRDAGLTAMNSDSAVPGLNRARALSASTRIPAARSAATWAERHESTLELIRHLESESQRLAALRDALLPELLSGRIRVPVDEVA
ncbi:restriction endonuclease subunit S [Microbacterium lacusdiani]